MPEKKVNYLEELEQETREKFPNTGEQVQNAIIAFVKEVSLRSWRNCKKKYTRTSELKRSNGSY